MKEVVIDTDNMYDLYITKVPDFDKVYTTVCLMKVLKHTAEVSAKIALEAEKNKSLAISDSKDKIIHYLKMFSSLDINCEMVKSM